ncbi:MAG: hypothetical protein ACT4O0_00555 [Pseudonocardia sp.]
MEFSTGWRTHDTDAYRLDPKGRGDWYYTVGVFRYAVTGVLTVRPPALPGERRTVEISYQVHVHDSYDWHPGQGVTVGPVPISDRLMGLPHRAGLARQFQAWGSSHVLHHVGLAPGPNGTVRLFPLDPGSAGGRAWWRSSRSEPARPERAWSERA